MIYRSGVYSNHVYSACECSPWLLKYIHVFMKLQMIKRERFLETCLPQNSVGTSPRYITAQCGAVIRSHLSGRQEGKEEIYPEMVRLPG